MMMYLNFRVRFTTSDEIIAAGAMGPETDMVSRALLRRVCCVAPRNWWLIESVKDRMLRMEITYKNDEIINETPHNHSM